MSSIKELYRRNVYGLMGTLIFHILLVAGFLVAELKMNVKVEKEEAVLLDIVTINEKVNLQELTEKQLSEKNQEKNYTDNQPNRYNKTSGSNQAVNDALKNDKFFDDSYRRDIEGAKQMVTNVNNQLSKKIPSAKKFEMPEATTEGQDPDSIRNVIYSGKSNIHYYLENRFHVRLPIPVYLAKNGGTITVDIQVDRAGKVLKAEARAENDIFDPMLPVYATQAAERTVFNPESKAPAVQKGTITYKFVAQ